MEKKSAHPVLSGSWPCTLWHRQLQHENLLQTARKGVGEAGSDFRKLSIASLAKAEGGADRLSDREGISCAVESMRVREACVRLFSLLHRANFVSVSPHPGRFLHFSGFLFHYLGLSEHAFSTYTQ